LDGVSTGGGPAAPIRERIEHALARWGHRAYRHAWLTIAAVLLVAGALITQLPQIEFDTSTESFLHEDDPVRVTYDAFREQFGRDDHILIAIEPPEVFDLVFLAKLRDLHEEIENDVPNLQEVRSLVNARHTRGERDELIVGDLLADWPGTPEELARIRKLALENPLYRNLLLSRDGRVTTITIETDAYSSLGVDDDELGGFGDESAAAAADRPFLTGAENAEIVDALEAIVARHQAPEFRIDLGGSPILVETLQGAIQTDMLRFTGVALAAIAAFLFLLFRRVGAVVLPLVVVILSLLCTLSIMAIAGATIQVPTQVLPSFLLAVGVGNSVHVFAMFFQRRRVGDDTEQAISFALGHSGLAIVMTSLTTAGGLVSFSAAELAPIAQFGVWAPVGVLIALVLTIVLLPALVAVFPMGAAPASEARESPLSQRLLVRTGTFATDHASAVVLASACLLTFALLGALQLKFSHYPIKWFPEGHFFRTSTERIDHKLRGSMFLEILIDSGRENGLHEPALLDRVDEMRRQATQLQILDVYIGKTVSLVDVVKEIHQALNENRPDFRAVPRDRTLVAQELLLFENSGSDDLEDVVDPQFRVGRFTMKVPFVDAIQYADFLEVIDRDFREILGDGVEMTITGLMALVGRTMNAVIHSMAKTYVVAFLVITPLMVLLIGNLRIGLLSMVPNLAPILITLGVMGWFEIPLDAFTLLIGSIAIGLAVDDTIHFMHNFRRYYQRSGDLRGSVRETLASTGQALLFTSLVLSTGFFLYMLASMRVLFYFGLLTGFTIIVAFLADVILAPALMALAVRPGSVRTLDTEMSQ
jgi:predicted RND superfamily exporter protein